MPSAPTPTRKNARRADAAPGVRDLARSTGFSVATISRVINGAEHVAPATRRQVLEAVAAHGYVPNPAARALSTRRSRTIGAIIPTLAHSIFATFLNAIERELAVHGYALVIATTGGDPKQEAARARDLLDLGAEGLIVSGAKRDGAFMRLIEGRRLPVVATSIHEPGSAVPTIGYDNRALGRLAVKHLRDLGHERLAVLHGPLMNNDRTVLRVAGVRAAARGAELTLIECSLNVAGGAEGARQALRSRPRPTAVLCLSDVLALGVIFEARRAGVAVPSQLSVMGFDDLDWAALCEPPLTTLHLPTAEMGQLAARALVGFLDRGEAVTPQLLGAGIVLRQSTAAAGSVHSARARSRA
ncbi:MAG: LacI family DNA-binding transcriptional regulator [Rubrivivax sp.]|nr:LacI family DNA-binding transcriptional regulator [Rubrivivax sp.]